MNQICYQLAPFALQALVTAGGNPLTNKEIKERMVRLDAPPIEKGKDFLSLSLKALEHADLVEHISRGVWAVTHTGLKWNRNASVETLKVKLYERYQRVLGR